MTSFETRTINQKEKVKKIPFSMCLQRQTSNIHMELFIFSNNKLLVDAIANIFKA